MFGIGGTELIVIGIVLLIAVGPDRLPKLLKAVVRGYREFRRATRDLRASTGIDEILQDEDLRDLRKPLYVPPPKQSKPVPAKPARRTLSYSERVQEDPPEGVDVAEIRDAAARPGPEEAERIRADKIAAAERDDAVRQAKIAAAEGRDAPDDEAERIRQAKIDAAEARADGDRRSSDRSRAGGEG
ncbi:MAG TPA: twin-arginine translocase TatA/TatE family subunit [Sandaracinaceae bacterium LLY-WYZ-13_1]|nr:twin-arginine translocase TatA/TatE family subunit [Sandaracinaceae bacterium LLY-WYZ-13_1]